MNKLFLILLLILPVVVSGQHFSTSLEVPALTAGRIPSRSGEPVVTFDKKIRIISRGEPSGSVCLYINTRTGDRGIRFGSEELGRCGLNIHDQNFRFALYRATGEVQSYSTRLKDGSLKYSLMTGNTEVHPVRFSPVPNTVLRRQAEVSTRRRDGISAHAYRAASGDGPTVFLYGRTQPPELVAQDFLGFGSIGYLKTNRGIFMAIQAELGSMSFDVATWDDSATQLDMHPFESLDMEADEIVRTRLSTEENKLRAESYSGECGGEQEELRRLKLEDIATRRQTLVRKNDGNLYENDTARRATEELAMPNFQVMNQEFEVKICRATARLSASRRGTTAGTERRLRCYETSRSELARLRSEWEAIVARHGNDIMGSYQERTRIRRELMTLGNNCQ